MERLQIVRQAAFRRGLGAVALAIAMVLTGIPALAGAQDATPAPGGPSAIAAMLGRLPATLPGLDDPELGLITVADLAGQLAAVGIAPPETRDDPAYPAWQAATGPLGLPTSASSFGVYTREDYGFDLLQADQTLVVAVPPFSLAILTGRFDHDAIRAALTAAGYKSEEVGGHEVLALRDDRDMDRTAPEAFRMANMNVAAFLPDGALAFAAARAPIAAVLDVAAGNAPSMLEAHGVGTLLDAAPADLVSATLAPGTALAGGVPASMIDTALAGGTPDVGGVATEIVATSEMPPILMALLGSTAGGPLIVDDAPFELPAGTPDARAVAIALLATPEMAATAAEVVEARLASGASLEGTPWAVQFPAASVTAVPGAPVLVVDLTLAPGTSPRILVNLLYSRDLGFLAW
jgi:hypothetical protein